MLAHKRIWLYAVGLVWLITLAGSAVKADKVSVGLKVCVQTEDGKPIKNAAVVLKGGKSDVKLPTDADGCYRHKGISFDTTKEYSIEVQSEGYRSATHAVNISKITPDSELSLDPVVLVSNGFAPSPTPSQESSATATPGSPPTTTVASNNTLLAISIGGLFVIAAFGLAIFWRHSNRLSEVGLALRGMQNTSGSMAESNRNTSTYLDNISASLALIGEKREKEAQVLARIEELLPRIAVLKTPNETDGEKMGSTAAPAVETPTPALRELSSKERSIIAYERFLNGETLSPEPLRLSDTGGSSADDLLGGRGVLLEEHQQGALLVLRIRETDTSGWIYPDIKWKYRGPELTSVFPKMTNEQYDCLKTQKTLNGCGFEPVAVRLDPTRLKWQIEVAPKVETSDI